MPLFHHLRPSLWRRSRAIHVLLFSLGSLMLLPAMTTLYACFQILQLGGSRNLTSFMDSRETLILVATAATACLGILAWTALGLLLCQRSHGHWQRLCWAIAALYGLVAVPTLIALLHFILEQDTSFLDLFWPLLIVVAMILSSALAAAAGTRFAWVAHRTLRQPPGPHDQLL